MRLPLTRVISGGQTGVDQVGLNVAWRYAYPTGGWVPKGWRTDEGPAPWLADFGCQQHGSAQYTPRTIANARWADLTVWFGDPTSPGGVLTLRHAPGALENPTSQELREAICAKAQELNRDIILNVAGNRLRTNPVASERAKTVLVGALAP